MMDRVASRPGPLAGADVIARLRDLEDIRLVKHRFMRCLDLKLWDEIGGTLTGDAALFIGTSSYGQSAEVHGSGQITVFLRNRYGPLMLTEHVASQPEISVDGDTATGIWAYREKVLATEHRMLITSTGFCEERYERGGDGQWRIGWLGYRRSQEVMVSLDDLPSLQVIVPRSGQ
jgi:SnoaL-like domain